MHPLLSPDSRRYPHRARLRPFGNRDQSMPAFGSRRRGPVRAAWEVAAAAIVNRKLRRWLGGGKIVAEP
jgi:hypothetical protein